jgi:hypothetical protein
MSDNVNVKEVKGFGGEFLARFRGHKVAGGVSEANLGVTTANVACAGLGYGIMRMIKNGPAKNTKFGKFSLIELIKGGGLK